MRHILPALRNTGLPFVFGGGISPNEFAGEIQK
jgi:hypothetical protein